MSVYQLWVADGLGALKRPGLPDRTAAQFPPGSQKPVGASNVGAGILGAMPTTTITNGTGVSISGQVCTITTTVSDKVIPYFVNLGNGATLRNCLVTGPATEQATSRALVQGPSSGLGHVEWSTINPQTPSSYYDAVGTCLDIDYCDLKNTTDGVRAFRTDGALCNIKIRRTHIHDLCQWMPDVAGSRTITHNDGVQCQGTTYSGAPDDDVWLDGCWIDARRSPDKGNATSTEPDQVSALMLTPNVGPVHLKFSNGWLSGGALGTVNAGSDALNDGVSTLIVTNTIFEKPGTNTDSPTYATLIQAGLGITFTGNTYESDGATVTTHGG